MSRAKIIQDAEVFAVIRELVAHGGDKAASFSGVARRCGLAAPTLVQRYGAVAAMVRAALLAAWDDLDAALARAGAEAGMSPKGAARMLKVLGAEAPDCVGLLAVSFRDPVLRGRAEAWRGRVEEALAARLGAGASGREAAALLFAAWQGQLIWQGVGGKGFRLKDVVKRV